MRYRVQVNIYVNQYEDTEGKHLNNYTQVVSHTESVDVEAANYAAAGSKFDAITAGIRGVLHDPADG